MNYKSTTEMGEDKSIRNSNIELLRIILMYAILFWHILVHGGGISQIGTSNYEVHAATLTELLLCCVLCVAVDCFIFISGYFGIKFKWHTFISFIIMGLFYSLCTFGIAVFTDETSLTTENVYKALCPFSSNMWWFFTDYLILYALSPLINQTLENLQGKRRYIMVLVALYVIGYLYHMTIGKLTHHSTLSQLYNMIFIYVLGRYMSSYQLKVPKYMFAISEAVLMIGVVLMYMFTKPNTMMWHIYTNGNPIVILAAISLFCIFASKSYLNIWINRYASAVFAIYLVTDAFFYRGGRGLYRTLYMQFNENLIYGIVIALVCGSIIVLIEYWRKKMTDTILNKIV